MPNTKLYRAANMLDEAIELCITLKSSQSIKSLEMGVLDRMEKGLRSLRITLRQELAKTPGDQDYSWQIVDKLFAEVVKYIHKLFALFCELCSLPANFTYRKYEYW
ncbi:MAG TPA: hypothetical protein DHV62_07110 [Elusimicrobia bacterium]|jgi:hypothetical protein|nr:hypothetical protein [Elusimicrobiota bacterium]